jgi:GrpB-like predicted nucleotidyltransferase (UPF0157 family)
VFTRGLVLRQVHMSIVIVEYDPLWMTTFEDLRQNIWPAVSDLAMSIEHVGSTSVPGLAAKPIIDMTVVVRSGGDVPTAVNRLAGLGYVHQGNLGIDGREAFRSPAAAPRHHLYLCATGSLALRNHLAVRGYLRAHPEIARQYGDLKKTLASQYPEDIDAYTEGKTAVILKILGEAGLQPDELTSIERANRRRA